MCLVFAKSGVELLLLTLQGQNQFWRWQTWVLLSGLGIFALLQLWYLHKALVLADPTLVCPCEVFPFLSRWVTDIGYIAAFCFYNLSSIVNGLVYFDQFSLIPPLHLGLVGLGIVVLLGGVWVVSVQSEGKELDVEPWSESGGEDGDAAYESLGEASGRQRPRTVQMERETISEPTMYVGPGIIEASRPSAGEGSMGNISRAMHRRRTTGDTSQHGPGAPPPVVPVLTMGTGFQIGLSPVSPGFAIVPRERGRRVSGLSLVDGAVEEEMRRRSEGDVVRGRRLRP